MALSARTTRREPDEPPRRWRSGRVFAIGWTALTLTVVIIWASIAFGGPVFSGSPNGVEVLPLSDSGYYDIVKVAPGTGGRAYVAGVQNASPSGYAIACQYVDGDGTLLWSTATPCVVGTAAGYSVPEPLLQQMSTTGNAYVGWTGAMSPPASPSPAGYVSAPYGQLLGTDGGTLWSSPRPLWSPSSWPTAGAEYYVSSHRVTGNGAGGVFGVWQQGSYSSSGTTTSKHSAIVVQNVGSDGTSLFGPQGATVTTADYSAGRYVSSPQIQRYGDRFYVAWVNSYSKGSTYTSRVWTAGYTTTGGLLWRKTAATTTGVYQHSPSLTYDPTTGSPVVTWVQQTSKTSPNGRVYTQYFTTGGGRTWGDTGKLVAGGAGAKYYPGVVWDPATSGRAYYYWADGRYGNQHTAVYSSMWRHDHMTGKWVRTAARPLAFGGQNGPDSDKKQSPTAVPIGSGGAYVVWTDYRDGAYYYTTSPYPSPTPTTTYTYTIQENSDIYAQRLGTDGGPLWGTSGQGAPIATQPGMQDQPNVAVGADDTLYVAYRNRQTGSSLWVNRWSTAGGPAIGTVTPGRLWANDLVMTSGPGGRLVTIGGTSLGQTPGRLFLNSSEVPWVTPSPSGTSTPDPLPSGVQTWSDSEIVYLWPYMRAGRYDVGIYDSWGNPSTLGVVDLGPNINSLSRRRGRAGDILTIRGRGFGPARLSPYGLAGGWVFIRGHAARVKSWSDTKIVVVVPRVKAGRTKVIIEVDGARSNARTFRVLR